jgi:hypothetical protein
MPEPPPPLTRADLPDEFTAETVRGLPISTLSRLADHRNGILTRDEQRAFDKVMHEVMRGTAERVSRQLAGADWSAIRRGGSAQGGRTALPSSRVDEQMRRIARRMGQQVDVAETLAPGVDWSFAQSGAAEPETQPTQPPRSKVAAAPEATVESDGSAPSEAFAAADEHEGTVADLEQRLTEQAELIDVMSEIADISKRTYALEQQRDLQSTRSVFFGFVVSVAVLVAGWAPLVAADDWDERIWIVGLALGTCLIAGAVYALVRRSQNKQDAAQDAQGGAV